MQATPFIPKRNSIFTFLSSSPAEHTDTTSVHEISKIISQHLQECIGKIINDQYTIITLMKILDFKESIQLTERVALDLEKNLEKISKSQNSLPLNLQLHNLETQFPLLCKAVRCRRNQE